MEKITLQQLQEKCNEFKEQEKRGTFYDMALNLLRDGYEIESFFLILATWNFATFRYAMKEFDINDFKLTVEKKCNPIFERLKDKDIQSVNLDEIKEDVKKLYNILSDIKGVKYTGASKLMHLKIPKLFIMWDEYIKRHYGFGNTSEDYLAFLRKMQELFSNVKWTDKKKTLAKAIDEYNYVKITLVETLKNKIRNLRKKKEKGKKINEKELESLEKELNSREKK